MAIATPTSYGGYEYKFVNPPPDRCICNICHLPSRDVYMTGQCCEGQTICKSCLDQWQKTAGNMQCPVCREEKGGFHPNYPIAREVKSLHIHCTNKEKGCEWQDELNDINNHLGNSDGCQFEEVKCSNECGKMIQRRYLTSHAETECPRRKVTCQYCHDTGEHQFIEGQHKEECPKLPLPCPNKCEVGSVPREDMEQHREECQLEVINCSRNCGEKFKRKCIASHLETECPRRKVICQYCHDIGEHQFIEGQHKEECPKLPLPCPNKCEVGSVPCENMKAHRKECPLEMIQCEYYSVGCEAKMARKDQEKHKKENMEGHLTMTKQGLSKLDDIQHETKAQLAIALEQINNLTQLAMVNSMSSSPNNTKWPIILDVKATILMLQSDTQMSPVTIKMSEYNGKKKDKVQWYSDPFCTSHKGYKMCLNIDAAGVYASEGTHLSAFLFLMKGPHDDELTWPLREKFGMKLLNQISDSEHHSMTVTYDDRASDNGAAGRVTVGNRSKTGLGWERYISNEDLNKVTPTCQYLRDDCLFFQVTKL